MQEAHFQKMDPKASWDPALITPAGFAVCPSLQLFTGQKKYIIIIIKAKWNCISYIKCYVVGF